MYNLAGSTLQEQTRADFICDGAEDLRGAYLTVIYRAWDTRDTFVANLPATLANMDVCMLTAWLHCGSVCLSLAHLLL